ncbi:MAG: thiolase family protein [Dehalococcoidia bacterium]
MTSSAFITGVGGTAMGHLPQSSCMSLHREATIAAVTDAGLTLADIDGVLCAYSFTQPHLMLASWFSEYCGLHPGVCFAIQAGGATAATMVAQAASLVASGQCRHVLLVTGDNRLSGLSRDGAVSALATVGHREFEQPFGVSVPASYALVAARYMHEYGTTSEELAGVAVAMRKHAARHPSAHMRSLITVNDVTASRLIASPLRLLDCSLISDGGCALVVSGREAARDQRHVPIAIAGIGHGHTHEHLISAPSLTSFGCAQSAAQAMARAGVAPADIDVAAIYDSFTITLIVELECMGFFQRGEAGGAALRGELDLTGKLPCNTHGGLLSHGHPGAAGGMFHIHEAVLQLRGTASVRQVANADLAFVHGDGGILSAHCSLVLARGVN